VVSGTTPLVAEAFDAQSGTAGVRFRVDGGSVGAEDTVPPFSVALDSRTLTDGPHVVTAIARDVAGNTATSAGVPFVASNPGAPVLPLSVTVNQSALTTRDVLVATVHAIAGVVTTPVDAYVVVQVAGGYLSLQLNGQLVPGLVPIARGVVVPTVSIPFSFPLAGAPPRDYVWLAGLTRPGTLDLAAPLASTPFTIAP
jgi:hypothetical protein